MKGINAGLLIVCLYLMQSIVNSLHMGILKAFLSPPMPRINRIKNATPRDISARDPFAVTDFVGLVQQYDYPAEEHNVTTADGYKLIIHRIPYSPKSPPAKKKPIVLLQHGILSSSDSWVLIGPGKDLAFLLADIGYDVWIGNFRGNTYARSHISLNPEEPAFWQFSFHEMGHYDIPAMIDHIFETTRQKTLSYIGHSMGTTTSYVLLSTRPEYNKRLRLVVHLAPVAYWRHELAPREKLVVANGELIEATLKINGLFELAPQSSLNSRVITAFCSDNTLTQRACVDAIFTLSGFDYPQLNMSIIPHLSRYFPAGVSLKTLSHFHQNINSGKFRCYDYGYAGNLERYGRMEPPDYNLSKVTAPVALFYGLGDMVAREEDVQELLKILPNIVTSVAISYKPFNHIDFLWANDGKRLLYDDVITLIRRFK